MGFDYSSLADKIVNVCKTHATFAKKLGISTRSESLKMNNKREWKPSEIVKSCDILDIPYSEIPFYFFTPKVQ